MSKFSRFVKFNFKNYRGYSLIELLVVIATISLIFIAGLANFRRSQRNQELSNAILSIKTDIRFAQELALSGKKPTGCNSLNGYVFDRTAPNRYKIYADCNEPPEPFDVVPVKNITDKFPSVSIGSHPDMFFNVLGRGVKTTSNIVINVSNSSGSRTITVTQGGEIN